MIREPRPTDQAYLASSWVRSLAGTHNRLGPRWGQLGRDVDSVLDRPETRALLCVDPDRDEYILGFIVYAEALGVPCVHYVFTRRQDQSGLPLRRRGIATILLAAVGLGREQSVVCTSLGPDSRYLRAAYPRAVRMTLTEYLR